MKKIKMALALALAACAGTGSVWGQVLGMSPVGETTIGNGAKAYVVPQTTVVVDIKVTRQSVVPGPYARFAQKYFGVIAPLAAKETYTIESARISYYDNDNPRSFDPGMLPSPVLEYYSHVNVPGDFPRVLPDRTGMQTVNPESAAAKAAQAVFDLRKRRAELVTGDYAENVYGAGLEAAIDRMDMMENEYLELFFGKQTGETYTERYYVTPAAGAVNTVVCRFRPESGLLPADDLSAEPVVLECRPQGVASAAYPPQRRRTFKSTDREYAVADMVDCRVLFDKRDLGEAVIPIYQYGVRTVISEK